MAMNTCPKCGSQWWCGHGDDGEYSMEIKDSGARVEFPSGMVRDVEDGKVDYTLILDGPMFERWAVHLTKGAVKYQKRNWMKADSQDELERFKRSALRHLIQWLRGDLDEDHAAAIFFNINGAEYVKALLIQPASKGNEDPVLSNPDPPLLEGDGSFDNPYRMV